MKSLVFASHIRENRRLSKLMGVLFKLKQSLIVLCPPTVSPDVDQKPKSEQAAAAEPSTSQPPKTEETTETTEKTENVEKTEPTSDQPDQSKVHTHDLSSLCPHLIMKIYKPWFGTRILAPDR